MTNDPKTTKTVPVNTPARTQEIKSIVTKIVRDQRETLDKLAKR